MIKWAAGKKKTSASPKHQITAIKRPTQKPDQPHRKPQPKMATTKTFSCILAVAIPSLFNYCWYLASLQCFAWTGIKEPSSKWIGFYHKEVERIVWSEGP